MDVDAAKYTLPEQVSGCHDNPRELSREERRRLTADLLAHAAQAGDDRERHALWDRVVVLNMEVARSIASRYRGRGIADEDLDQVSRIQELQGRIWEARDHLVQNLGRSPRPTEVAEFVGEAIDDVVEALAAKECFTPTSLDRPVAPGATTSLADLQASEDSLAGPAEARLVLAPAVRRLKERDRRILFLRFFEGCTQEEIAREIGVTQMQVSRILSRIFSELRGQLEDPPAGRARGRGAGARRGRAGSREGGAEVRHLEQVGFGHGSHRGRGSQPVPGQR